jgi:hypothetical protein
MLDIQNLTHAQALAQLPDDERDYQGSSSEAGTWPYGVQLTV